MEPETVERPIREQQHQIKRTTTSRLWSLSLISLLLLIVLLVFILQNAKTVQVSFLMLHGNMALGVALLMAAVIGGLLVGMFALARILQLRHVARVHRNTDMATSAPKA